MGGGKLCILAAIPLLWQWVRMVRDLHPPPINWFGHLCLSLKVLGLRVFGFLKNCLLTFAKWAYPQVERWSIAEALFEEWNWRVVLEHWTQAPNCSLGVSHLCRTWLKKLVCVWTIRAEVWPAQTILEQTQHSLSFWLYQNTARMLSGEEWTGLQCLQTESCKASPHF